MDEQELQLLTLTLAELGGTSEQAYLYTQGLLHHLESKVAASTSTAGGGGGSDGGRRSLEWLLSGVVEEGSDASEGRKNAVLSRIFRRIRQELQRRLLITGAPSVRKIVLQLSLYRRQGTVTSAAYGGLEMGADDAEESLLLQRVDMLHALLPTMNGQAKGVGAKAGVGVAGGGAASGYFSTVGVWNGGAALGIRLMPHLNVVEMEQWGKWWAQVELLYTQCAELLLKWKATRGTGAAGGAGGHSPLVPRSATLLGSEVPMLLEIAIVVLFDPFVSRQRDLTDEQRGWLGWIVAYACTCMTTLAERGNHGRKRKRAGDGDVAMAEAEEGGGGEAEGEGVGWDEAFESTKMALVGASEMCTSEAGLGYTMASNQVKHKPCTPPFPPLSSTPRPPLLQLSFSTPISHLGSYLLIFMCSSHSSQAENSVLSILSRSISTSAACAAGVLRWVLVILNTPGFYNSDRLVVWLPGFLRLVHQTVDSWPLHRSRAFMALIAAVYVRSEVDGLKVIECKRAVLRLVLLCKRATSLSYALPLGLNGHFPTRYCSYYL
jgi:hypothetical protein